MARESPFPAEYLVEINKILLVIADAELLLNAPELHSAIYEDFSTQEDSLKVLELEIYYYNSKYKRALTFFSNKCFNSGAWQYISRCFLT